MNLDEIIESATMLKPPNNEAAQAFNNKKLILVERVNQIILERSDLARLIGGDNIELMKDNHHNHALFMASLFLNFNPKVLVETILWVFKAYRSRDFDELYWPTQLNAWMKVIGEELEPQQTAGIIPIYHWMIVHVPQFTKLSEQI